MEGVSYEGHGLRSRGCSTQFASILILRKLEKKMCQNN